MPRIPDHIVDCSIYVYPSERSAQEGASAGGSGFLAHVPSPTGQQGYGHPYAITNRHLVDGGCRVLRINRKGGGFETISTEPEEWIFHPDGDDVAARPLSLGDAVKWWSISTETFVSHDVVDTYRIGYGDEVFLVGRLSTHEGRQKNAPVVRFGNISSMADPTERVKCPDREQESFLVDCRSLSGFSGSPVFVMTTQVYRGDAAQKVVTSRAPHLGMVKDSVSEVSGGGELSYTNPNVRAVMIDITNAGDWGHMRLWKPVYEKDQETETGHDYRVEANTGIACVVPAWRILDLLNVKEFKKQRSRDEKDFSRKNSSPIVDAEAPH